MGQPGWSWQIIKKSSSNTIWLVATSQIAKYIGSTLITHRSEGGSVGLMSKRCRSMVFVIRLTEDVYWYSSKPRWQTPLPYYFHHRPSMCQVPLPSRPKSHPIHNSTPHFKDTWCFSEIKQTLLLSQSGPLYCVPRQLITCFPTFCAIIGLCDKRLANILFSCQQSGYLLLSYEGV